MCAPLFPGCLLEKTESSEKQVRVMTELVQVQEACALQGLVAGESCLPCRLHSPPGVGVHPKAMFMLSMQVQEASTLAQALNSSLIG